MRAVGVGLVAVAAIAAIYFWNDRRDSGEVEADSGNPEVSSPSAVARTDGNSNNEQQPVQVSTAVESESTEDVASDPEPSQNDPFRVVENAQDDNSPLVEASANSTENLADQQPDAEPLTTDDTGSSSRKVVIPAGGYPVEDSMKYFVPKHERRPGNLGGPPPPAFMVPENADGIRSIESMLPTAPEAPGQ